MEQTVYGDILFFVNFCMDFQCMFLTAKLLRRPFPLWRGVLASALGALYACIALFLSTSGIWAFAADCGVCLLMCLLCFFEREAGARRAVLSFLIYFVVSFAVGGVMSGMASLLSHVSLPLGEGGAALSSGSFLLLAALGGATTLLWGRFCQRRAGSKRTELSLDIEDRRLTVRCMVDTANLLRDPVGGAPVVLVSKGRVRELLSAEYAPILERGAMAVAELPPELARRVRLIPAHTATGSSVLTALAPDSAFLGTGKLRHAVELLVAPVELAVDRDDYEALLPAELLPE